MAAPVAARSISSISVYSRRSPLLAGPLVPTLDVLRGLHKGRCRLHLQRVVVAEAKNTEFKRVGSSKSKSTATVVASPETVANQGPITYDRLLPCPQQSLPPRVEHMLIEKDGNILDIICDALDLPPLYVTDLIRFGAVHYSLECPTPPASASAEQLELYNRVLQFRAARKKERASLKGKTLREAQKTHRITSAKEHVEAGTYLRVHVHPKRFPRVYEVDWPSRVIAETDSFVVLDKPAGVSVGGTVDNLEEMSATFVSRALRLKRPLILTHQIDTCTEGCVVYAKTKQFSSHFHMLLRERKVKKEYTALAAAPVATGRHVHYMRPDRYAPRIVSKLAHADWANCELDVLNCKQVPWPSAVIEANYRVADCGWAPRKHAYECSVHLLTGRTHQVRVQFAALGAPLVGDSVYMAAAIARKNDPHIDPFLEGSIGEEDEEALDMVNEQWRAQHGLEPECAFGLQASVVSWEGESRIFKAGRPWWRQ